MMIVSFIAVSKGGNRFIFFKKKLLSTGLVFHMAVLLKELRTFIALKYTRNLLLKEVVRSLQHIACLRHAVLS